MQYPVGYIEVCFNAFPEKNKKINYEPIVAMRLNKLMDIHYKKPGKYC
jgi:hypothetical protein